MHRKSGLGRLAAIYLLTETTRAQILFTYTPGRPPLFLSFPLAIPLIAASAAVCTGGTSGYRESSLETSSSQLLRRAQSAPVSSSLKLSTTYACVGGVARVEELRSRSCGIRRSVLTKLNVQRKRQRAPASRRMTAVTLDPPWSREDMCTQLILISHLVTQSSTLELRLTAQA